MTQHFLDFTAGTCFVLACICLLLYTPRLAAWLGAFKPQKRLQNDKMNRIAVIIPAKNEGKIIDDIFASLQRQSYPREYFDIHVVVKDAQDITIEKTKAIGGFTYVVPNQKCKGDALDACLKQMMKDFPDVYDAFYIADADCLLGAKCLEEMNCAMASGAMVIQSKKLVKNYLSKDKNANSLASACNGLIWTMIDDMGNRYKADHGITQMTIGTGLLLTKELVDKLGGWPYRATLTEDMELMNDCAIQGYPTFYYSYSVIYVEESTSLHVTNIRRTRWLTGLIDSKLLYNQKLVSKSLDKKCSKNIYFVTALWPAFYYVGLITFFTLFQLADALLLFVKGNALVLRALQYAACGVITIYVSFLVLTGMCMLVDRKNIKLTFGKKIVLFLVHPIFYMGYIPIIAKAFLRKNTESWEAIERVEFSDETEMMGDMEDNECYPIGYFEKNQRM